jgi:potassium/hydrogen antiporter
VASRLRVPGLVLFLALGMLVGPDGLGLLDFDDIELAQAIGVVALVLILYEGGLAAGWGEIRPVLWPSLSLAVVGTMVTALVVGLAARELLGLTTLQGLLLGAIVAPTDSAAVFSVLRGSSLERRLARTLEGESGFNDPVAIVLVIGLIDLIDERDFGALDMTLLLTHELALGALVGLAAGWLGATASTRVRFATTGLYPVASIATAALAFGIADQLGGSGFLAVYLTGLSLGGAPIPRRTVTDFHDGLAWVSQIAVFFTLGLLVGPSELADVAGDALLVAAVLMLLARPFATSCRRSGSGCRDARGCCSAGPVCAAPSRSCSRPSP